MEDSVTRDFVSSFADKQQYLDLGRGVVILKDGIIVSGASSYTRYNEGIEIEVDTVESERRNRLATIACSALILRCLKENLYPSWDAHDMNSVHLAENSVMSLIMSISRTRWTGREECIKHDIVQEY